MRQLTPLYIVADKERNIKHSRALVNVHVNASSVEQ